MGRMTALSDTLTIGLVLVLLFGSIALYLYTRIQQAEQKINLLESILLDLKMSAEIKSYTELPADNQPHSYQEFRDLTDDVVETVKSSPRGSVIDMTQDYETESEQEFEEYKGVIEEAVKSEEPSVTEPSINYESMTLKELQTIAKQRNIVTTSMKKNQLIEALRTSDKSSSFPIESGSMGSSPFLETSATIE
jgi:hypothetical protein